ncbi:ABC transporter permease [Pararhizobium mangrovi]|uniref:ABC transporter permease n=1 Tax=Pararhizobium mangrovi TaxID=2590452 RepID=A0A506UAS1_9HYPH|nr:ABC transporter permease [Pararhizobium mangrovi]TPW30618.1 ABC transporter permease [Pararhizobium mangrovi]
MGFFVAQLLTGMANAGALFLVASGLSIIFGVTRVVNFAHGSFYMLGAYIAYTLMSHLPGAIGFWSAIVLTGIAVGLIGLLVEIVVLKPIYRAPELYQLVATFGVILVIQDAVRYVWGPEDLIGPRAPGFGGVVSIFGQSVPTYDLVLIALSLVVLAALWALFNKTRIGVLIRAATQDREMVGALGVNQTLLFSAVFFLGSFLAGIGGAAQLPKGGADLTMDLNIITAVFVVVVIGGMGSIFGAFMASVLISELQVFGVQLLPQSTLVLMFVVMAIILVVRPQGLFGRPDAAVYQGNSAMVPKPLKPLGLAGKLVGAAILAFLAFIPFYGDNFLVFLFSDIIIFCLFAASLHFILGIGGMASFGHAAYYGGGAYVAALLVQYLQTPMELAIVLAPLGAGFLALIIGWFCVRLSGVYFAMLTLAFAQVVWSVVVQWTSLTGGTDGILNIWPSDWASDPSVFYYVVLVVGAGGIIALRAMAHTPFGYALRGTRDSSLRAEAIGIHVRRVQLLAFAFAGAMAGLAGALFVFAKGSIFPTELAISRSFDALIMVFFGGVQSLGGPIAGASVFTLLQDWLSDFTYWQLLLGVAIIAVVILSPRGITGLLETTGRIGDRFRTATGSNAEVAGKEAR